MLKSRLIDTDSLMRGFIDIVNTTGSFDIKDAIMFNVNNYLFSVGKDIFTNKFNLFQDKIATGFVITCMEEIICVCNYLERTDYENYKKYIEKYRSNTCNTGLTKYVENDVTHYVLPKKNTYKFVCKDNTIIICKYSGHQLYEEMKVYFIGKHKDKHYEFLNRFLQKYKKSYVDVHNVYMNSSGTVVSDVEEIVGVNEASIILEQKRSIFDYIYSWKQSKEYFTRLGLNHKIGILLYGDPGTGKTTFAKVLATKFELDIVKFSLNDLSKMVKNSDFWEFMKNSVVVLEDIDCLVSKRDDSVSTADKENFQALLQLLDGINHCENTIFVATTNYIDRLDSALIRDGRFDIKIEMKNFDRNEAIKMCNKFEVNSEVVLEDETFPINPASLQNKIITLRMEEVNKKLKQKAQEIGSK